MDSLDQMLQQGIGAAPPPPPQGFIMGVPRLPGDDRPGPNGELGLTVRPVQRMRVPQSAPQGDDLDQMLQLGIQGKAIPALGQSPQGSPQAGMESPSVGSVMASGAEAGLGGMVGMPVDMAQMAGNMGIWGYNKIRDQFNPSPDLFTRPNQSSHAGYIPPLPGGSESILKGMEGLGLKPRPNLTEPWQKYLYAGTAGAAGMLPTMLIPGAGPIRAGKMLGDLMAGAGGGVASEGAQEAAHAIDPNNPTLQAGAGLIGGLVPGGGAVVGRMAARPFLKSGQRTIAGNILNQEARGAPVVPPGNLPPGFQPTTGQATNNPGLVRLERTFEQSPDFGPELQAQQQANQANLRGHLQGLSTNPDNDAASIAINQGLKAYRGAFKRQETATWQAIDPANQVQLVTGYIRQRVATTIGKEPVAYQRLIDPAVAEDLAKLPYNTTFPEIHAILSKAKEAARNASYAGEANKARVMNKVADSIENELTAQMLRTKDPAVRQRYMAARAITRHNAQTYKSNPVGNLFAKDKTGAPRIQPTATAGQVLRPGAGQAERWDAFKKAVNNNPQAISTARDWFANHLIAGAVNIDGTVSPAKLKAFREANAALMKSDIFTPQQKALVDQIERAANMAQKVARGGVKGGSDTAAKLLGGKYVDVLIGSWTNKILHAAGAGGGALAGHALGVEFGEFGGLYAGFKGAELASKGMDRLYALPAEKVRKLLVDALRDPALARDLMMEARGATSLPRTLQRYLLADAALNQSGVLPAARQGQP